MQYRHAADCVDRILKGRPGFGGRKFHCEMDSNTARLNLGPVSGHSGGKIASRAEGLCELLTPTGPRPSDFAVLHNAVSVPRRYGRFGPSI
jgi:hypothetical protein